MASIFKHGRRWRAQVRIKNKPTISDIFDTKNDAKVWARQVEADLHKSSSNDPSMTFGRILDTYIANSRPGGDTKQTVLRQLRDYWADWRISEIHSGSVTDYVNLRQRGGAKPCTILQHVIYLQTVLRHGGVLAGCDGAILARERVASAVKTLRHLGKIAEADERTRRPTQDELEQLADFFVSRPRSNVPMADIMLWAICTCCRLGEITGAKGARLEDLDPEARTIWVRGRKHPRLPEGRDDCVPLLVGPVTWRGNTVDPLEIALRQRALFRTDGPIFRYSTAAVESAWIKACKQLGIEDLRFHDLRHEGISRLFEADYDIPQVAAVSGHRSWKHLRRYTHLRPGAIHGKSLAPIFE